MTKTEKNRVLWGRPGFLARRFHQINVGIFLAEFENWKITPVQWGVLTVVATSPGLSHTEIAVQCGIDRVNVRDVLIRLEERKMVKQTRSSEDRRQSSAVITPYGENLLKELEPNVRHAHEILLSPLKPKEKKLFLSLLSRIVDENNELSRAPLPLHPAGRSKHTAKAAKRTRRVKPWSPLR